jgi:hypothetical protein
MKITVSSSVQIVISEEGSFTSHFLRHRVLLALFLSIENEFLSPLLFSRLIFIGVTSETRWQTTHYDRVNNGFISSREILKVWQMFKLSKPIVCYYAFEYYFLIFSFQKGIMIWFWIEKILTMVYVVQSYWACFGLYPSSCMWKTKIPQRFGYWICLLPQVDRAG